MKQLLEEKELVGKTILRVSEVNDTLAFVFEDETFAIILHSTFYGDTVQICDVKMPLQQNGTNAFTLEALGFITQEERDEIFEKERLLRNEAYRKKEKAEYERLKKKFG